MPSHCRAATALGMSSENAMFNRQQSARDFLIGCSLVGLLYVHVWGLLFAATTPSGFFLSVSPLQYYAAIATVVAGGVLMVALTPIIRKSSLPTRYLASIALVATIGIVLNELRKSNETSAPNVLNWWRVLQQHVSLSVLIVGGSLMVLAMLRYALPLARFYRKALLPLSVFTAYVLARAVWTLLTVDFGAYRADARQPRATESTPTRVVMIVFDEMDSELAFSRRPAGLRLPDLDALRSVAITFDSAYSPGPNTIESMPSYLIGRRIKTLEPLDGNSFRATLKDGSRVNGDSATSIFSAVAAAHGRMALVGFALPYCRLHLTVAVERCTEIPMSGDGSIVDGDMRLGKVVAEQLGSLLPFSGRRGRIAQLQVALDKATSLAADSNYSFVFLHLPIPHYPWIWDRHTSQYRVNIVARVAKDGYLGNLELTDIVLRRIREAMLRAGTWDATTLIVTSDHPWRLKLSQGTSTDERIPLIIKLAGQTAPEHISSPTNSIVVSSLIPMIVAGRLSDPGELRAHVGEINTESAKSDQGSTEIPASKPLSSAR